MIMYNNQYYNKYNIARYAYQSRSYYATKITSWDPHEVSLLSLRSIKKGTHLLEHWLTRKTGENKLLYLMEVAWNLSTYLLSLLIANRNASWYFMILKRLLVRTYL